LTSALLVSLLAVPDRHRVKPQCPTNLGIARLGVELPASPEKLVPGPYVARQEAFEQVGGRHVVLAPNGLQKVNDSG
jgi:hypothetical protein